MWKKFQKFSIVKIVRYELLNSQKSFLWPCKKLYCSTSQAHISMKKCPKWWCFFGFILQGKLATCLENFRSFGIVQTIGKNSKWKEIQNNSKYQIDKNLYMEVKNVNPNCCNLVINNSYPMILFFSQNIEN